MNRAASVASCSLAVLTLSGCSDAPFRVAPVKGSVAYEDEQPLPAEGYYVKFVPQIDSPDGKTFARIATAKVAADGSFDGVTTYQYHDGLTVGEHLVYLQFGTKSAGRRFAPEPYLSSESTPIRIDFDGKGPLKIRIPAP